MGTVLRRLANLLRPTKERPFDSLQVEVTNDCFLRCPFCPREVLRGEWRSRTLPLALFQRLAPSLPLVRYLHLQGWGEPLLHPDLQTMVSMGKAAGCHVSFTTNGVLLRRELAERVVASGVDLVAVSISGATSATHDATRVGSHLPEILANVAGLAAARDRSGRTELKIVLSYLMQRHNLGELPGAIDLAAEVGAQELVATNLDCAVSAEHEANAAFTFVEPPAEAKAALALAGQRARAKGVTFRHYPLAAQSDVLVCEARPLNSAVVAADGGVFPCVYLTPAVARIPRRFRGEEWTVERRPFGSIADLDLESIWREPAYVAFRAALARRQHYASLLLFQAQMGYDGEPAAEVANIDQRCPLPEVCRTCYKAFGL